MEQEINIIARLLATENINIITDNVETAAFDLVTRTLILPTWKMNKNIKQVLVAHEVGHARYTTPDKYMQYIKDLGFAGASSYMNILEDARIERFIKDKYPGIKKTFLQGYTELVEQDFFGVKHKDIESLHLLDRMNLYFKVGFAYDIPFSDEEKTFVERASRTTNLEDIKQLAQDIHAYSAGRYDDNDQIIPNDFVVVESDYIEYGDVEEMSKDSSNSQSEDSDDQSDDGEDSGDAGNNESAEDSAEAKSSKDKTEKGTGTLSGGDRVVEKDIITQKNFDSNIRRHIDRDQRTIFRYVTIGKTFYDPIISHKTILEKVSHHGDRQLFTDFMDQNNNNINYMVKEFELKKAAATYNRSKQSKTGSIDIKKLWGYKTRDDIFKSITVVDKGKNHGMVLLLDWSGSMSGCIKDTIRQLLNLVIFCKRVNIPFQVFAFVSGHVPKTKIGQIYYDHNIKNPNEFRPTNHFMLLDLFNHNMSQNDFNLMACNLLGGVIERYYSMCSTPLNEALIYMIEYLDHFQNKNKVEKLVLVTLTDGCGSGLDIPSVISDNGHYRKVNYYFTDPVTKKHYKTTTGAVSQTAALLSIIRDRYHCRSIAFYLTSGINARSINAAMVYNDPDWDTKSQCTAKLSDTLKDKKFVYIDDMRGRDRFFIIPTNSLRINEKDLCINQKANTKSIANKFSNHMKSKMTSRVLLNNIIEYIAG